MNLIITYKHNDNLLKNIYIRKWIYIYIKLGTYPLLHLKLYTPRLLLIKHKIALN